MSKSGHNLCLNLDIRLGTTILMRRQNVTASCLNFAKSYFAIPDSGVK